MILEIKRWPDPILFTSIPEIDQKTFMSMPDVLEGIGKSMVETMMSMNALGLACNQVGGKLRVFTMNVQKGTHSGNQLVLFNPWILEQSTETWAANEGCLSFPKVELKISRPKEIVVGWQDHHGRNHSGVFTDIDAKCFCHELDHLNGKVFKEYVSDLKFNMAQKKAKKL